MTKWSPLWDAPGMDAEQEARALISAYLNTDVTQVNDGFGYTWQVVEQQAASTSDLVTSLHAVNAALEAQGFGPMLLCSNVYFRAPDGRTIAVVYLSTSVGRSIRSSSAGATSATAPSRSSCAVCSTRTSQSRRT